MQNQTLLFQNNHNTKPVVRRLKPKKKLVSNPINPALQRLGQEAREAREAKQLVKDFLNANNLEVLQELHVGEKFRLGSEKMQASFCRTLANEPQYKWLEHASVFSTKCCYCQFLLDKATDANGRRMYGNIADIAQEIENSFDCSWTYNDKGGVNWSFEPKIAGAGGEGVADLNDFAAPMAVEPSHADDEVEALTAKFDNVTVKPPRADVQTAKELVIDIKGKRNAQEAPCYPAIVETFMEEIADEFDIKLEEKSNSLNFHLVYTGPYPCVPGTIYTSDAQNFFETWEALFRDEDNVTLETKKRSGGTKDDDEEMSFFDEDLYGAE